MWVIFLGVVLLLVMVGFLVWYLANEVFLRIKRRNRVFDVEEELYNDIKEKLKNEIKKNDKTKGE